MNSKIRSFVKRKGRTILSKEKQKIISARRKNGYFLDFEDSKENRADFITKILSFNKKICFEIGFGAGEHLIYQAENNPEHLFIGCEPFVDGCLKAVVNGSKLDNFFVFQGDAIALLEEVPNDILDKVFILFPDPWPKKKHHKRRIIREEHIKIFADKMKEGGTLRVATDHSEYASWIIAKMEQSLGYLEDKKLVWNIGEVEDWYKKPEDWINTRYQQKALAGKVNYFFDFLLTV